MKGYTQNGRFKIELSDDDKEGLFYAGLFVGVCAFFYFTLIWESPATKAKNEAIRESFRVAREANATAAEKSVVSRTPTPAGDLLVVQQGGHHYAILQHYKGNQMTHHPDCPCGKKETP